ncbi:hypothetical protein B0H63DRAFT_62381 [Podospora didyma]|uniref:Uncharacterized protein n=1 Tax=Podospora didyma TaxID=330526 RepID=A0AAE0U8I4_9PEZI|nr:hypothetical protein B0H63DRAFT_62381 [Podospora didyma]
MDYTNNYEETVDEVWEALRQEAAEEMEGGRRVKSEDLDPGSEGVYSREHIQRTIEVLGVDTDNTKLLLSLPDLTFHIQTRQIKPGVYRTLSFPSSTGGRRNAEAALMMLKGLWKLPEDECLHCQAENGPFAQCVAIPGIGQGSCANCHYNCAGERCSFRQYVDFCGKISPGLERSITRSMTARQEKPGLGTNTTHQVASPTGGPDLSPTPTKRHRIGLRQTKLMPAKKAKAMNTTKPANAFSSPIRHRKGGPRENGSTRAGNAAQDVNTSARGRELSYWPTKQREINFRQKNSTQTNSGKDIDPFVVRELDRSSWSTEGREIKTPRNVSTRVKNSSKVEVKTVPTWEPDLGHVPVDTLVTCREIFRGFTQHLYDQVYEAKKLQAPHVPVEALSFCHQKNTELIDHLTWQLGKAKEKKARNGVRR